MLSLEQVNFSYQNQQIFNELTVAIADNKITTIVGPNGSGKSTLFKLLTRGMRPNAGRVLLDGKDIWKISSREFAQKVALVHQKNELFDEIKVRDLIKMGRLPYQGLMGNLDESKKTDEILAALELNSVKDKLVSELSGGQQQRVWLGLALAQEPEYLFLDEPTTYLDLHFQVQFLQLIKKLNRENGLTICMILHDLNQALRYSDQVILVKNGEIESKGLPEEVLTQNNIRDAFGIDCHVIETERGSIIEQF